MTVDALADRARRAGLHPLWCKHVAATLAMAQAYGDTMTEAELADTIRRAAGGLAGAEGHPLPCAPGTELDIARAMLAP